MLSINKRRILTTASIVFSLFITEQVIEGIIQRVNYGDPGKINSIINKQTDKEIMIWGASSAEVNISPYKIENATGKTCFNMGLDGTNIDQYDGLLKYFLSYTDSCKKLIIALDIHGGLAKREQVYNLYCWLHHMDQDQIFESIYNIDKSMALKSKYVPFYNLTLYNKHALPYIKKTIKNVIQQKNESYDFPDNGYVASEKNIPDDMTWDENINILISDTTINKLKKIIMIAEEKQIQTYIVITPCLNKGYILLNNRKAFISSIEALSNIGAKVLDLSSSYISENPDYFYDNIHLNKKGSEAFTDLLISKIEH